MTGLNEDGIGFLKMDTIPDITEEASILLKNLTTSLGGATPKKGTTEHTKFFYKRLMNCLKTCAELTGNEEAAAALPIDIQIIKKWKLKERGYVVPPYQLKGNTIQVLFVHFFRDCYANHCEKEKEKHDRICGGDTSTYLPGTPWIKLEPLVGIGIRCFLQHWHLHPKLSREEAHKQGKAKLEAECKDRQSPKKIIDRMVSATLIADLKKDLLALKTETKDGHPSAVFQAEDNDLAQTIIPNYLNAVGFRYNKKDHLLDWLTALQAYVNSLPNGAERNEMMQFGSMSCLRCAEYIEAENKQKEAAAKKVENEAKKKEREEKKRKRDQELLKEQLSLQKQILTKSPEEVPTDTADKPRQSRASEKKKSGDAKAIQMFIQDKLPSMPHTIAILDNKTCDEAAPSVESLEDHSGPKKTYQSIADDQESATVTYKPPGQVFGFALKQRVNHIYLVVDKMEEVHPGPMKALLHKASQELSRKGSGWLSVPALCTVASMCTEAAGKATFAAGAAGPELQDSFFVEDMDNSTDNFCQDIQAIADSFLHQGKLLTFPLCATAFHLLFAETDRSWDGQSHKQMIELIEVQLKKRDVIPAGAADSVRRLAAISQMLEENKGEDPFVVFETEINCPIPIEPPGGKGKKRGKNKGNTDSTSG